MRIGQLYAILDTGFVAPENAQAVCKALLDGGADILQLRAKKESLSQRIQLMDTIYPICEKRGIPIIVNDDVDLALAYPRAGLHVGQDDMNPLVARERLGAGRILGYSTHSLAQAQGAIAYGSAVLDYFAVGPVFATATKPEYTEVGLELVRGVAALKSPLPFFCIGGITRARVGTVLAAGGQRVVAISDLLNASDIALATREMKSLLINPAQKLGQGIDHGVARC